MSRENTLGKEGGGEGDREERNRENSAILHNIYFCDLTKQHKTQKVLRKEWNLRVDVMVSRKTVQYPFHPIDSKLPSEHINCLISNFRSIFRFA